MKVVTICGSMRFQKEMISISRNLERDDAICVLQPVYFLVEDKTTEDLKSLENFKNCHFKKIEISDAIYVVNIGGYVGHSTRLEIEYAKNLGKEIIYHEK